MRIALICHLRFPISEPFAGGLEKHTHIVATELVERGHEVTVYAAPGSGPGYRLQAVDPRSFATDDRLDEVSRARIQLREAYTTICDHVAAGRYDAVHNNSLHYLPWLRAGSLGAPVVHVLHTPPIAEIVEATRLLGDRDVGRVVAVSRFTGEQWAPHVGSFAVVPNGIRVGRWRYSSRPVPGLCAFAGRITPVKGVHVAIDAAREAGRQLLIAGPIRKEDEDYFREEVSPRLDRRRRYLGHLSSLETSQLLSNAECLVSASDWDEPFGLVLAESLACGTPVAGFDRGGVSEVLTPETGVLVPPGQADQLAGAIERASYLSRRACRRLAAERFDLTDMVDDYERCYRQEPLASLGDREQLATVQAS